MQYLGHLWPKIICYLKFKSNCACCILSGGLTIKTMNLNTCRFVKMFKIHQPLLDWQRTFGSGWRNQLSLFSFRKSLNDLAPPSVKWGNNLILSSPPGETPGEFHILSLTLMAWGTSQNFIPHFSKKPIKNCFKGFLWHAVIASQYPAVFNFFFLFPSL